MDTLAIWWRENAVLFVLGSLAWTGAVVVALRFVAAPLLRQRIAEAAIAAWMLCIALGFVPREEVEPAAAGPVSVPVGSAAVYQVSAGPAAVTSGWPDVLDVAGALLGGGLLLACCYLLVAALLLGRLLHRAQPAPAVVTDLLGSLPLRSRMPVRVLVSDTAWRPFCCGLLHPTIVLPRALLEMQERAGDAHMRSVLMHEMSHITRGDLRGRLLFAVAMPVQFWNPFFWRLRRGAGDAAELLADEVAAGHSRERVGYARSLIDLAELLPATREARVAALGLFGSEIRFQERMTMLLNRRTPLSTHSSRFHTACRFAAFAGFAFVAAACWTAPKDAPEPAASDRDGVAVEGPRVFFAFEDSDIAQVVDTIAKIAGANIVVDQRVTGTVTLKLRNVPWREALDVAVRQVGAQVTELDRGILEIAPASAVARLEVRASAEVVQRDKPEQVLLDVRIKEGDETVRFPKLVILAGQEATAFVGNVDDSGAQTGLVVEAMVDGGSATLDVARHDRGKVVASQRTTIAVKR